MVRPRNPNDGLSAAPTAASAKERTAVVVHSPPAGTSRPMPLENWMTPGQDIAEYAVAHGKAFVED